MHHHDPSEHAGPLRGTTAWWRSPQERAGLQESPQQAPSTGDKSSDGIRHDLVQRVRREIAAGTYDTPEKWQAALDRLLQRLERD
jgi:hypothetical protein